MRGLQQRTKSAETALAAQMSRTRAAETAAKRLFWAGVAIGGFITSAAWMFWFEVYR